MTASDLAVLKAALDARRESCWDRLEDAVDELLELHGVPREQILGRIRASARAGDALRAREAALAEHV